MQLSYICTALTKKCHCEQVKTIFISIILVGIAAGLLLSLSDRRFRCHGGMGKNHEKENK